MSYDYGLSNFKFVAFLLIRLHKRCDVKETAVVLHILYTHDATVDQTANHDAYTATVR